MRTKSLFTCLGAVPLRAGRRRVLPALIAVLSLIPAGRVTAQTFTTLYSFNGSSDGANPEAGLTVAADGKTRYGTTANGGNGGWGTVFAINTDGTGFTNLHSFNYSDGANPWAGLVLSGHTLYGTASNGGDRGAGTVFAINTDGTGFTNLHGFTPVVDLRCRSDLDCPDGYTCTDNPNGIAVCSSSNGAYPNAGLILSGNTLYGTAAGGGNWGNGTVFAVNTDGTGFTNLHNFTQQIIPCLNGSCPPGYHCVAGICVPIPVYGCPGGCYPGYCV